MLFMDEAGTEQQPQPRLKAGPEASKTAIDSTVPGGGAGKSESVVETLGLARKCSLQMLEAGLEAGIVLESLRSSTEVWRSQNL